MSRYYRMSVRVEEYDPERQPAIEAAIQNAWGFDEVNEHDGILAACGDDSLSGGETEEAFTERLAKAIWKANGRFCQVQVNATYLEALPYEEYAFDEASYRRLMENPLTGADRNS